MSKNRRTRSEKMVGCGTSRRTTRQSKAEQKKKEAKEQSRKYRESLEEMNTRVYSRPLLVELDERTRSIKVAKGRALISIKNQLKASKISIKNYFTDEELSLMQLAEESS